jgi:hypothetical protein
MKIKELVLGLALVLAVTVYSQTGEVLHGSVGKDLHWGSGWIDLAPTNFFKGDQLRLSVGGTARKIVVRLLEDPQRADSPEGVIGIFPVGQDRVVIVPIDADRKGIRQLSVHGNPTPWNLYKLGEGNGPATLSGAQVIRGDKK